MNLGVLVTIFGLGALIVFTLKVTALDKRAREAKRGWRLRCVVAGRWAYEEQREGAWVGIEFAELGDHRESPHVIGVPSREEWRALPVWASGRRDEIVSRVRTELTPPRYVLKDT